jgi:phosphoglycolate phosphatase
MPMRGLLFDKDGTLLDFRASWSGAFRELCLDLCDGDIKAAEAMLAAGGMDVQTGHCASGSVLAAGNTGDLARHWFPELSGDPLQKMVERLDRTFHANGVRCSVLLPGVAAFLEDAARTGLAMGVATSDSATGTRDALSALGVQAHLPHIFGYDSVARPKPAPDIVHAFSRATGVPEREIVVIGDNPHDLEMARSAGAGTAIGVLSGNSRAEDLAPLADAVLESVCDLPAWLRARGVDWAA